MFDVLKSRLEHIMKEESVVCEEGTIEQVIDASGGDLRKAITLLQSASHLKGIEGVTGHDILEIAGVSGMFIVLFLFHIDANLLGGTLFSC